MIRRLAPRVGLIVLAAVAASWLAYDLRALSLDAQGRAEARAARNAPQVAGALSLFAQAAQGNADPTPRIDQARFLLTLGRTRQALDVLSSVVRLNPGNVEAWILVASATATSDAQRFANANEQLRALFGHPAGSSYEQRLLPTPRGTLPVVPGRLLGLVEGARVIGAAAQFEGWAAALATQPGRGLALVPAQDILIVSNSRVVASGPPTAIRPDVSRAHGAPLARAGFTIDAPTALLVRNGRKAHVEIFAILNGTASPIGVNCRPIRQAFGCGD